MKFIFGEPRKLVRRADLLDAALVEYDDALAERHRFDLVMSHIDHRILQLLVQAADLDAHLHSQAGVEVRQRLVEQKNFRLAHDGAADGHALPLAARQFFWLALQQMGYLQNVGGTFDRCLDLGCLAASQLERKRHVLEYRHVRVKGVRLEHHRQPARSRRQVIGALVADAQFAAVDLLQARDHAQQGRFAAAGRPDKDDQLAVVHVEVKAVNDSVLAVEALDDIAQADCCHAQALDAAPAAAASFSAALIGISCDRMATGMAQASTQTKNCW
jgi:hypothetical protein